MKNKKAFQLTMGVVVTAIILLITAFVVIGFFTGAWAEGTGILRDKDGDNIINLVDKCPCTIGTEDNSGCPSGIDLEKITETQKKQEAENCKKLRKK